MAGMHARPTAHSPACARFAGALMLAALGALPAAGCERPDPRIQQALQDDFAHDPSLAGMLCGFPVRSFTDVTVREVQYDHSNQTGPGRAVVTGTALPFRGAGAAVHCGGHVSFDYSLPAARARGMNGSRYYDPRTEHVVVTNFVVLRRDATGP
jgi:hypothetical protein